MADMEPVANRDPIQPPVADAAPPWRGLIAFTLLAVVGAMGPDIAPSRYFPDLDHYIPRYIILALAVGFGLSAVRSRRRMDRLLGVPVLVIGGYLVVYIVRWCMIYGGW